MGGPGLLEDVYEEALCRELVLRGLDVERQVQVPMEYKGSVLKRCMFLDVLVNDSVVVEVKATEKHSSLYEAQLLTYLRLSNKKLGLLINFGESVVSNGVRRVVNGV